MRLQFVEPDETTGKTKETQPLHGQRTGNTMPIFAFNASSLIFSFDLAPDVFQPDLQIVMQKAGIPND